MIEKVLRYVDKNEKRFQEDLFNCLRIPSISADTAYQKDVRRTGEYVVQQFKKMGLDKVTLHIPPKLSKSGMKHQLQHPIVTAEKIVDQRLPTVLVYGHYDVQPPDPLDLWDSSPFEPKVKNNRVYARGANDNKGQLFVHLKSVEAYQNTTGMPVNVKFLVEGEEEIGSASLLPFIIKKQKLLQADYLLISDTEMIAHDVPAITYGLRGLCHLEILVTGPKRDLHSGIFGGTVVNPAVVLVKMLADLTDDRYQVKSRAFYQGIKKITDEEKENFEQLPWYRKKLLKSAKISRFLSNSKLDFFERSTALPTFDINGIISGYTGEGEKTIIPSWALAKTSFRIVPGQDSEEIRKQMTQQLHALLPSHQGLSLKITSGAGGNAFVTDLDSVGIQAAQKALKKVFSRKPHIIRFGGTLPIISELKKQLDVDVVLMGFGLSEDNIHAPNESFSLKNFRRGIDSSIHFFDQIAKLSSRRN